MCVCVGVGYEVGGKITQHLKYINMYRKKLKGSKLVN